MIKLPELCKVWPPALVALGLVLLAGSVHYGLLLLMAIPVFFLGARSIIQGSRDLVFNLVSGLVLFLALSALTASLISPFSPQDIRLPAGIHVLGLDSLGRDQFSRLLWANRNTFMHAMAGSLFTCLAAAGFAGLMTFSPGKLKWIWHVFLQIFLSFPALLLFLLGASLAESVFAGYSNELMVGLIVLTLWAEPATLIHSRLEDLRHAEFVQASRLAGFSASRIFFSDLLPNLKPLFAINVLLVFIQAIVLEAILGFLGIGSQPGEPNLGKMIYSGLNAPSKEPVLFWSGFVILLIWIFSLRYLAGRISQESDGSPVSI